MKTIAGAAALLALGAVGTAYAGPSEDEILRMFIPAEISLVKDGDEYSFQSDLAVPFYTFDDDEPGVSNCTGTCTETWWPVRAKKSDARAQGAWTLIEREEGRPQWAYKGQPIYYYLHDQAGTKAGDGIDGKWHVLKP
tara:strand:+ start:595 stop:1008 length:414 start_codon:yes stop_codon:yes gene_type:complete